MYLYNATAVFTDVCDGMRNIQIMLKLTISACLKKSDGKISLSFPGFAHAASNDCYGRHLVIKHYLENATHLLYKEGIEEHTGGSLIVRYTDNCPVKCRNYTFLLLILKRNQNRIQKYKLDVDNTVFLGLSHNGFRLTVQPPLSQCRFDIDVRMQLPKYKIIKQAERPPVFWSSPLGDLYTKK